MNSQETTRIARTSPTSKSIMDINPKTPEQHAAALQAAASERQRKQDELDRELQRENARLGIRASEVAITAGVIAIVAGCQIM